MKITLENELANQEVDALVVACYEDQTNPKLNNLLATVYGPEFVAWFQKEKEVCSYKKVHIFPSFGKYAAKQIVLLGLGKQEKMDWDTLCVAVGQCTHQLAESKVEKAQILFSSFLTESMVEEDLAHFLVESIILANYRFADYKTDKKAQVNLNEIVLTGLKNMQEVEVGVRSGKAYAEGTCLARDLVNTPGNLLTPTMMAQEAKQIAERHNMEFHVLEREQMEELGMGALLAVAQGSCQPPKMIVLKYQGLDEWKDVLGFVGKGLTFDTGGISLKPAANMDEMKMDMGGGAAVLGAMDVIGTLKPACNILAVIPSTENMPSGKALKPGDVITSLSGKTIEVKNTDAEGRLILADGITYAKQLGADYLVDIATLTGAVIIALGECTTGAITNNEDFVVKVLEAAQEAGELMWRLPNFEPYKKMVKSSAVADLNNAPGRPAGSITAGLFLGEFAEETPWVHLDIAGTAWSNKKEELTPKGATGVMVRTLAVLAETFTEK